MRDRALTALSMLASLCFKHMRTHREPLALLASWGILLRTLDEEPGGRELLSQVVRYIRLVSSHIDRRAMSDLLERALGRQAKDAIMTAGEQLIQQGVQQGASSVVLDG